MSKKKKNPKNIPKKAELPKKAKKEKNIKKIDPETSSKRKKTAIIISAAAVFLAVCILVGIFVVKPAVEKNKEPSTVSTETKSGTQVDNYTYVDYNGVQMVEEFAEILNQAAIDSAAACEKYGVAFTLGDRNISRSEFHLYYLDQYRTQMTKVTYSEEKSGANRTGYDPDILPDEQNHPTKDITWAEQFTIDAADAAALNYSGFDMAIQTGVELTESEIAQVMSAYKRAEEYARQAQKETDQLLADTYTEGLTYAMFSAREIMSAYAEKYENGKKLEYYESYSEETVKNKLNENLADYQIIKARVYPIEGEYDPIEASKVKTEQEFIDFANNNYPYGSYVAETRTQCFYINKSSIESTFGTEVADWMFSSDRVQGETAVVKGQLFDYLVHIIELPYFGTSCHIMSYEVDYNNASDEEGQQAQIEEVKKMYEDWKNGDATPESFAQIAQLSQYEPENDVRTGVYTYEINNWLFDKTRKSGDTEFFTDEYGIYVIYYIQNNEDDYDWDVYIRNELANADYEAHFDEVIGGKSYEIELNKNIVTRAIKSANVRITSQINERKNSD